MSPLGDDGLELGQFEKEKNKKNGGKMKKEIWVSWGEVFLFSSDFNLIFVIKYVTI